ncbi:hypothetical protein [Tardiphaga sp.]|uniref:hypothetical protein n=1 Tax=Tardiphaga sp. TaxID=1926292 RepID=UPI0026200A88|nr:hypothetical protein [Tardiphaga sp.]MDB5620315.1 hypothetical protein [Tardiphaga sp.]
MSSGKTIVANKKTAANRAARAKKNNRAISANSTAAKLTTVAPTILSSRASLSASSPAPESAYVTEVFASYIYDAASVATPNAWTILSSVDGGAYVLAQSDLTLPILGGGSDDWPNFAAANVACAATGIILRFGPGQYQAKSRQTVASRCHIVLNPLTEIQAAISPNDDNRDSVFTAYATTLAFDALAAGTNIGDDTVQISGGLVLTVGDFIVLHSKQFRVGLYQILAWDAATKIASLDRPLRMAYGSATGTLSFPAGSPVWKVDPPQNVIIECNGARVYGACNRFFEIYIGWRCNVMGPIHCGDGTSITATERIISFDEACYDCHGSYISGDGANLTTLGLSFESTEACSFLYCDMRRILNAGTIFQDAIDSVSIEGHCHSGAGAGVAFTAASAGAEPDSGTVWGSNGCSVVGGSYSGNHIGVHFQCGSSWCTIDGSTAIVGNTTGIHDELGNYNSAGSGVYLRKNFNGIYLDATSVGFVSEARISNNSNGLQVISGALGAVVDPLPFSNTVDVIGNQDRVAAALGTGRILIPSGVRVTDTTASIDQITGAVVISGGLGVVGASHLTGLVSHGQVSAIVPDGGYPLLLSGSTKALRVTTDAASTTLSGTDSSGSVSYQPLNVNGSTVGFQTAGAVRATLTSTSWAISITTASISPTTGAQTVAGGLGVGGAVNVGAYVRPGSYTVASLPTGAIGATVWCTNCCVFNGTGSQEATGVGTGGLVTYNGTAWKIAGTNVTAVA